MPSVAEMERLIAVGLSAKEPSPGRQPFDPALEVLDARRLATMLTDSLEARRDRLRSADIKVHLALDGLARQQVDASLRRDGIALKLVTTPSDVRASVHPDRYDAFIDERADRLVRDFLAYRSAALDFPRTVQPPTAAPDLTSYARQLLIACCLESGKRLPEVHFAVELEDAGGRSFQAYQDREEIRVTVRRYATTAFGLFRLVEFAEPHPREHLLIVADRFADMLDLLDREDERRSTGRLPVVVR